MAFKKSKNKENKTEQNNKNTSTQKNNKKNNKTKIPRTVQDSLGWEEIYDNGVMQIAPGVFSKSFAFDDISFKTKSEEDQEAIYEAYMRFLNLINDEEDIFITFVNFKENANEKLLTVLPEEKGDKYDEYRKELSNVLKENMKSSRNSISTKRYITVITKQNSVTDAMNRIKTISGDIENNFKKITNKPIHPLDVGERLEVIDLIMNGNRPNYWFEHDKDGKTRLDIARMTKHGYSTKDIVAPESLKYLSNHFEIGERLGQAMYLDGLANWMDSNFLPSITAVNFESIYTMHITALNQADAIKKIHNKSINITAELEEKQDKALKNGHSPEFVSSDLKKAKEQIDLLQEDILNRDQRLFFMSLAISHFAEDEKTLKEQTKIIRDLCMKYMCTAKPCSMQQERGFISSLPIGHDKLFVNRLLTTESLGVFLPFDEVNQFDKGGVYYGVNSINKSLIVYDRTKGQNFNGLVLGASGSGKSFSSKREMSSVILNKNANVYIIDPDGEYTPLADAFEGSVIKISPGNGVYINPFDLDIDTSHDTDLNPITMKTDFICGMLETMLGNGAKLTPIQKSIVDRCVQQIYRPYLEHLQELPPDRNGKRITIDRSYCPTMQNLFDALLSQPQAEAQNLALVMETYTTGAFDTFAHRTNVDVDNRLTIYDIKNIGTNLRELALKVCLNDVWLKMVENRKENKWTWFYVDEFHLLLSNDSTSEFLKSIWKRARKFNGVPTGITQNVEDLLASPAARAIINNTSFVYMLNQSAMDRGALKELLHLSSGDMEYVTNVEKGHGLIYTGQQVIPFEDSFPTDTKLFKIMSTTATEDE